MNNESNLRNALMLIPLSIMVWFFWREFTAKEKD